MGLDLLKLYIFILSISACATRPLVIPGPIAGQSKVMKTPILILPEPPGEEMKSAAIVFAQYANSDEFYAYVNKNVTELKGGNESNVGVAIKKFRFCLKETDSIKITWVKYSDQDQSRVIGGWRRNDLAQNPLKELDLIERAGHWLHEISHACGFTHIENDIMKYPTIKGSWPYQVGYSFENFLRKKAKLLGK